MVEDAYRHSGHRDSWTQENPRVPYRGGTPHLPGQGPGQWEREPDPREVAVEPVTQEMPTLVDPPKHADVPEWIDPIPVRVVDMPDTDSVRNRFSASRFTVTDRVTGLAGRDDNRFRLYIRNTDTTNEVYISDQNYASTLSFRLRPGDDLEMRTQDAVYAICASTETADVSIISEYSTIFPREKR